MPVPGRHRAAANLLIVATTSARAGFSTARTADSHLAVDQGDEPKARSMVAQLVIDLPQLRSAFAQDPDLRDLLPQ